MEGREKTNVPDTSSDVLDKPPVHITTSANEPPTEDQTGRLARDEARLDAHCTYTHEQAGIVNDDPQQEHKL